MRKLAREAVIFMLLTSLLLAVGIFVYMVISDGQESNLVGAASIGGLMYGLIFGLPTGLGFWIFYRAIRFAVKG